MPPVEASATSAGSTPERQRRGALRLGGVVQAAAGRWRRSRSPELASTARRALSRQRSRLTSTGAAGVPCRREARRADGLSASHTSSPRSGLPLGLIPHATPGGAKAAGSPASGPELAHVRGRRHPARLERTAAAGPRRCREPSLRAHVRPSVSGRPNITLRFWTACEEVPFQRLSIAESTTTLPVCASAGGEHPAEVRLAHVARAGRRADDLDERLARVGGREQLAQLGVVDRARGRHVAVGQLALVERDEVRLEQHRQPRRSLRRRAAARAAPRSPACAGGRRPCREGCSRRPSTGASCSSNARPAPEMPCLASITTSAISPARASGASPSTEAVG